MKKAYLIEPVAHVIAWREHIWLCKTYGIVRGGAKGESSC